MLGVANAGITYVDADLTNTTIDGAAPVEGTNYIAISGTDPLNDLWGYRTRPNTNGGFVWACDAGGDEDTAPLITTITIASAGTYDLYGHFYGYGNWDSSFSVGSDGPYSFFGSGDATQAQISDFEGSVSVADGSSILMYNAYLGTVTTTTANEQVSVYVQGIDGPIVTNDERTWYDGVGYELSLKASNPTPSDRDELYVEDVQFSWYTGLDPNNSEQANPAIVSHDLYVDILDISSTAEPNFVTPLANVAAGTDPIVYPSTGTMNVGFNKTVYWRVDEVLSGGGAITGHTWSFDTVDPALMNIMLSRYEFENNLNDSTVNAIHGTDPNGSAFGTGVVGASALVLDPNQSQYVELTTEAFPKTGQFNGLIQGSVSCWVKVSQAGQILSNFNDGNTTGFALEVNPNSSVTLHVRAGGVASQVTSEAPLTSIIGDNTWHLVTATWQSGGYVIIYLDGAELTVGFTGVVSGAEAWQYPVLIGATRSADRTVLSGFFGGMLDDLQVYNYALDAVTVADMYLAVYPDAYVCLNLTGELDATYDFDNNCRVDLADFAAFASEWLSCGRYPAANCQ
jgi:hypothetical protein